MAVAIGLSCGRLSENPEHYSINSVYVRAVGRCGAVPVVIPALDGEEAARHVVGKLDGLILTGGGDLDPALYGRAGAPKARNVQAERDRTEMALLRAALALGVPVLGICRGIQVINVACGGDLYVDIPSECPNSLEHYQDDGGTHPVRITKECQLFPVLGTSEVNVNSYHHQAVKRLGVGLRAVGWCQDGIVEAVEADDGAWLVGVQWHPERMEDESSHRLFQWFVGVAGTRQARQKGVYL
ncbi:MAG: gamma-glutamyl-gamma-aminobutyrate hydrolase family protein [Bacillota bacterium]